MVAAANLVEVAALVGDTARATMLAALMAGRSLTGTELAYLARITRSTASGHLAKLVEARLVHVMRKRQFNYYRIASPRVAQMLESMIVVAALDVPSRHQPHSPAERAPRFARTCYDHIAGRVGVAIADALSEQGHVVLTDDGGELTASGSRFLARFGIDLSPKEASRRIYCRPCLDWSERRYHIAGHVGAEICRHCLDLGWIERTRDSRAIRLTPAGRRGFAETFGADIPDETAPARNARTAAPESDRPVSPVTAADRQ